MNMIFIISSYAHKNAVPQAVLEEDLLERIYCKYQLQYGEPQHLYYDEINVNLNSLFVGGGPQAVRTDLWYIKEKLIQKNVNGKE